MKILVIEDEQQVASFIKQGLEEHSFIVEVAYDGSIGKRLALSREYDVVLLDIVIPALPVQFSNSFLEDLKRLASIAA